MKLKEVAFKAVHWFERPCHQDERGSFSRLFCSDTFDQFGLETQIVQLNQATNARAGTLRGMHYQIPPAAETKYVTCISGSVWDVVADLRQGSPTYLSWKAFELAAELPSVLVIPPGFAHGYLTLADDSHLIYGHTASYQPELEAAIRFDDPAVGIDWPNAPAVISNRDQEHPMISKQFEGVAL